MRAIKIHQQTIASIIARGISVKIKAILSGSCFALSTALFSEETASANLTAPGIEFPELLMLLY